MRPTTPDHKRFRAALVLFRDGTLQSAAEAAECTAQHLHYVLAGTRGPSERLLNNLRAYLSDPVWDWVTLKVDHPPNERKKF